jgi:hypothetical protein
MLGSSPIIAPHCLPQQLEHLKQHIMMWYLNQMNSYVEKSMGGKVKNYNNSPLVSEIDKLYALASQHTSIDVQQSFEKVGPAILQLTQIVQKFAPKPQMTSDDMVYMQTSMAETQRKAAKDAADLQLEQQRLQNDALAKNRAQQIEIALDANDNLTNERIKTAELTHDAKVLQHEQQQTALSALQGAQQSLGGPNGTQ